MCFICFIPGWLESLGADTSTSHCFSVAQCIFNKAALQQIQNLHTYMSRVFKYFDILANVQYYSIPNTFYKSKDRNCTI